MSEKRSLEKVQYELAEACQQLGFLQYQLEHEFPNEINKRINLIADLQKEMAKKQEQEQNAQAKFQQDFIDKAKEKAGLTEVPLEVTQ